jgi:predicted GTPase
MKGGKVMKKQIFLIVALSIAASVLCIGFASAQDFPVLDRVAEKVIQKYQTATCEQLWVDKGKQKSPEEERVINFLRNDPQMRTVFINKVAGPIANKMFECGMIP